jgi:hypothetical protein
MSLTLRLTVRGSLAFHLAADFIGDSAAVTPELCANRLSDFTRFGVPRALILHRRWTRFSGTVGAAADFTAAEKFFTVTLQTMECRTLDRLCLKC